MLSKRKLTAIAEIFLIFVFPVLLLSFGVVPVSQRLWLIPPVTLFIVWSIRRDKWNLKKIGIRIDNLKPSLLAYTIFTLAGVLVCLAVVNLLGRRALNEYWNLYHFQGFFILISAFQEFAFRGYLIPKLGTLIHSSFWIIITNSLLFSFLHIIFPLPQIMLPLAFLAGLAFATIYKFFPNLILITISHSILNFVAVLYCLFSFNNRCFSQ